MEVDGRVDVGGLEEEPVADVEDPRQARPP